MSPWKWSGQREQAALLVAQDELSDDEIASRCKLKNRKTLTRWKQVPAFAARVEEHRATWRRELAEQGLADRRNRVDALNDRWGRMQRVIQARATQHADVPGGKTGLLVRQVKLVKVYESLGNDADGEDGEVLRSAKRDVLVEEYAVDTGLLKELRDHEKQAAQELGQWAEKRELFGKDGGPIEHTITLPAIEAAERAAYAALYGEPAPVGAGQRDGHQPDPGPAAVPSVPLPGAVPDGSEPAPDHPEVEADGAL